MDEGIDRIFFYKSNKGKISQLICTGKKTKEKKSKVESRKIRWVRFYDNLSNIAFILRKTGTEKKLMSLYE